MHTSSPVGSRPSSPGSTDRDGSSGEGLPPAARRGAGAPLKSRWLPAVAVTALAAAVVLYYGVAPRDLLLFGVYVVVCLAVPGTLLLRALYRGRRTLAEEIALGLALGYALEVFTYIPARAIGVPLLVLAWPVTTYALFLLVPRLRRHWRRPPHQPSPLWWSWALALTMTYLLALTTTTFIRKHALVWPALGNASTDMPFQLALIGELRNHLPPSVPMVAGEPLFYHWFVYAHFAASSWITGIEPLVLLFRLGMLPMLAAIVILVGMVARRVIGSWTGAFPAVISAVAVGAVSLYMGAAYLFTWGGIADASWTSPTHAFGSLLFAPAVLLVIDLRHRRDTGGYVLLGVFLVAVMGAKAVFLPLLGAGLLTAVALETATRRRPSWPTLAALGMTTACSLFAQVVLFGGVRNEMIFDLASFARVSWGELTGLRDQLPTVSGQVGVASIYVLCWVIAWGGILGLASRPRSLTRPGVALMLGMGAAGLGAALLLGHPGRSQLFFLCGAYPYLAVISVYGALVLARRARISRRMVVCSAVAGTAVAYLITFVCGVTLPLGPGKPDGLLYRPYALLLAVLVLAAALLTVVWGRLRAWALITIACTAVGMTAYVHARVVSAVGLSTGDTHLVQRTPETVIPQGVTTAARWLRDHSAPNDVVATNAHCRWNIPGACNSGQSWIAALSERRVLVEGWSYTTTILLQWRPGLDPEHLPFWDGERLRLNDAAFDAPSAAVIRDLHDRYGVRWLFADERTAGLSPRIRDYATLVFRSGDCAVYRLPGA
ncbi:hypothetical protein ACQP2K_27570 [Microbispora siamensis]